MELGLHRRVFTMCNLKNEEVRTRRLELPRTNVHQPLKLARLPIPPRAHLIEVKIKKKLSSIGLNFSDRAGARTQDPLLKREMLCQLSYPVILCLFNEGANIKCLINKTILFLFKFRFFVVTKRMDLIFKS